MKEQIKASLRESSKREKAFRDSFKYGSMKFFLLEQLGIMGAIQDSNFDPVRKSLAQYQRDASSVMKIFDAVVSRLGGEAGEGKKVLERSISNLNRQVSDIEEDLNVAVEMEDEQTKKQLADTSQSFSYLIRYKAQMDLYLLEMANAIETVAIIIEDYYKLDKGEVPSDLKFEDLFDSGTDKYNGLPMSEEEIEKLKSDEAALNKKEEELGKLPALYKVDDVISDRVKEVDISEIEKNLRSAWEELKESENDYVEDIESELEKLRDFDSSIYQESFIRTCLVVKLMDGVSIADSIRSEINGMQAAPLFDVEKLASQGTEDTMEETGIGLSEKEMVDFIEKYLVKKLGIGGSADNSVALFLKLANANDGLLDDSDIRRLVNA